MYYEQNLLKKTEKSAGLTQEEFVLAGLTPYQSNGTGQRP